MREKYYRNRHFRDVDQALLSAYQFVNPYTVVKDYLEAKGEGEIDCYGETPLATYEEICKACDLKPDDRFLELGCGRGRGCFFVSHFFHCKVVGIDCVPDFIDTAEAIMEGFHMPNIKFRCENMLSADYRGATCIYVYGTCLQDEEVETLAKRFAKMPKGTRIATVSYPLSAYEPSIEVVKTLQCTYPWGNAEVFIHHV